jgi:hypothetical protein
MVLQTSHYNKRKTPVRDDATIRFEWKARLRSFLNPLESEVSKPVHKLAQEVTFGALCSGSLQLASIGRTLREPVGLHQTEKRLSRMLGKHGDLCVKVEAMQLRYAAERMTPGMVLAIDPGDLNRNGAQKSEYRARVRDGSTGEIVGGYPLMSVVARDVKSGLNLPVLTRLHSGEHPDYKSENTEILTMMETVCAALPEMDIGPLWTIDRGGDRGKLWRAWIDGGYNVLVRATNQRFWQWRGRSLRAQAIAKELPCKYEGNLHRGKKRAVRYGVTEVCLPAHPDVKLTMIVVRHGHREPLVLVTTRPVRGKVAGLRMIRSYMDRWVCEEGYRFTKQGFSAEKLMVRSFKALKNLVALASLAWAFLACEDRAKVLAARDNRLKPDKSPAFAFYSILAGWQNLFAAAKSALYPLLRPSGPPPLPLLAAAANRNPAL